MQTQVNSKTVPREAMTLTVSAIKCDVCQVANKYMYIEQDDSQDYHASNGKANN